MPYQWDALGNIREREDALMATEANAEENFEVTTSDAVAEQAETAQAEDKSAESEEETPEGQEPEAKAEEPQKPEGKADADNASEKRGSRRLQKRIDKLTKRAAEAERKLAEMEAKSKPETQESKEPDPSDFDDYDEYLDKLVEFKEQAKAEPEADSGSDVSDDFKDALEECQEAFEETRKLHDDFDELITADDLTISDHMVVAMAETDDPGAVAYHLAKNKAEAARIAGLSPTAQALAIGRIEAKLQAKPTATKKQTAAPDPIDPVAGRGNSGKSIDDMDFAEYEKTRNAQDRGSSGFW